MSVALLTVFDEDAEETDEKDGEDENYDDTDRKLRYGTLCDAPWYMILYPSAV